jgi:hypothetical protein
MPVEKLEAAVMGINNFPGCITPWLDIVDGGRARFFAGWLLVTRRCQGGKEKDGCHQDNPARQRFPRSPD